MRGSVSGRYSLPAVHTAQGAGSLKLQQIATGKGPAFWKFITLKDQNNPGHRNPGDTRPAPALAGPSQGPTGTGFAGLYETPVAS